MTDEELARLRRDFLLEGGPAPVWRAGAGDDLAERLPCCVAIGAFDGVHRGHRDLIAKTVADARARGVAAVAVTFDPDPDVVVRPEPAPKLLLAADRIAGLSRSGVDGVLVVPFDAELAALDHAGFFERVLLPRLDIRSVHVGADFRLGAGGRSTVAVMGAWCAERGIEVAGHRLLCDDGAAITATRIRGLLAAGALADAERLLGRRHFVRGTVVEGRHEGAALGFPTANVALPALAQRPPAGVYAGFAFDGTTAWPAAINVGVPPTFQGEDGAAELEANLLGFSGDLYGATLAVLFTTLLRPQRAFASLEELASTVRGNIEDVRRLHGERGEVLVP